MKLYKLDQFKHPIHIYEQFSTPVLTDIRTSNTYKLNNSQLVIYNHLFETFKRLEDNIGDYLYITFNFYTLTLSEYGFESYISCLNFKKFKHCFKKGDIITYDKMFIHSKIYKQQINIKVQDNHLDYYNKEINKIDQISNITLIDFLIRIFGNQIFKDENFKSFENKVKFDLV